MRGTERLRNLVAACRQAVVFTGAGISTESGIADFRRPGGIWSRHKPIYFEDFMARLIILNRDPTPLDSLADLVLNAEIGPTLSAAVGNESDGVSG